MERWADDIPIANQLEDLELTRGQTEFLLMHEMSQPSIVLSELSLMNENCDELSDEIQMNESDMSCSEPDIETVEQQQLQNNHHVPWPPVYHPHLPLAVDTERSSLVQSEEEEEEEEEVEEDWSAIDADADAIAEFDQVESTTERSERESCLASLPSAQEQEIGSPLSQSISPELSRIKSRVEDLKDLRIDMPPDISEEDKRYVLTIEVIIFPVSSLSIRMYSALIIRNLQKLAVSVYLQLAFSIAGGAATVPRNPTYQPIEIRLANRTIAYPRSHKQLGTMHIGTLY